MRDLAKSMISWGWSMSVFTALQGARFFTTIGGGGGDTAVDALKTVTDAATPLLTAPAKAAWEAGVAAQDAVLKVMGQSKTETKAKSDAEAPATAGEPVPIGSLATKLDA